MQGMCAKACGLKEHTAQACTNRMRFSAAGANMNVQVVLSISWAGTRPLHFLTGLSMTRLNFTLR